MANENKKGKDQAQRKEQLKKYLGTASKVWKVVFTTGKVIIGALATVLLIGLICGFVFANSLSDYLQDDVLKDAYEEVEGYDVELNSYIYYVDADGQIQPLQQIYAETSSQWANYEDIPEDLINAAMAIEDHRFLEHQGVDWITTIKACVRMFLGDDSVGGSSITQQLIKNMLLQDDDTADDVTVRRKVLEIFRAVQYEKKYDKKTIMEMYLNCIYLGQGCRGVRSAAATYFGKELEMLTTAECASLISITNSPTYYDPYQNYDNNMARKNDVLWAMKTHGWLTEEEYQDAIKQEIVLKVGIDDQDRLAACPNESCGYKNIVSTYTVKNGKYYCPNCGTETPVKKSASRSVYSWYVDTVIEDVAKAMAEKDGVAWNYSTKMMYYQKIQKGGYHIYSCLDMKVQNQVDKIYTDLSQIPKARGGQQLQSAIVITDNRTGDIVALSGGVGEKVIFDDWNRATDAELQSGSSIKPLSIYAPGFESGAITPATVIKDLPLHYNYGAWPLNANRDYQYKRTVLSSVTSSINAVAAQTLSMIGTSYSYDFAKNKFGLSSLVESYVDELGVNHSDIDYAPLAMGAQTWGVKVRDMTNAFGTFANNGVYREGRTFTIVYDSNGEVVLKNDQKSRQILSNKTVNYMNYCLVTATQAGTGTEANLAWSHGVTTAGKTGSTADMKDRWYCGFTGYYTAAVWCGYDSPEIIYSSGNPAAQLWKKVMGPLHKGVKNKSLYSTSGWVTVSVCLDSGGLATEACTADVRGKDLSRVASVMVHSSDVPKTKCTKHVLVDYCSGGGVATDYCKKFAAVDSTVKVTQKGLVKLTQKEISEIYAARGYNLNKLYLKDDYVYLVGSDGSDSVWKGFYGNMKRVDDAPYKTCTVHTEAAWEAYEQSHPPVTPPTTEEPTVPTEPSTSVTPDGEG